MYVSGFTSWPNSHHAVSLAPELQSHAGYDIMNLRFPDLSKVAACALESPLSAGTNTHIHTHTHTP